MQAFLVSFGIIFVAELGDKSQLMAMTFAARYRATTILIAITVATALVHLASVLLGAVVGLALPTEAISVVAGVAFLGFAVWTLRGVVGQQLGSRLPERSIRIGAAVTFVAFGVLLIAGGLR